VHTEAAVAELRPVFLKAARAVAPVVKQKLTFDVFISYSWLDRAPVDHFAEALQAAAPGLKIFLDRSVLRTGVAWQQEIYQALDRCRKVIALYSDNYLASKMCQEEYNIARLLHRESDGRVLWPIYLKSTTLPAYMRAVQYVDCREADFERLSEAARNFVQNAGLPHG
jgi:hypothetical protein